MWLEDDKLGGLNTPAHGRFPAMIDDPGTGGANRSAGGLDVGNRLRERITDHRSDKGPSD
jgi:hypothetical protein